MRAHGDDGRRGGERRRRIWTSTGVAAALIGWALVSASHADAGRSVDPDTLNPPPPPGSSCQRDGRQVICHTVFVQDFVNEPVFELPCGLFYETSHDDRRGTRWYINGKLHTRFVSSSLHGTWSLSPVGAGPLVTLKGNANWRNVDIPFDQPEENWPITVHGNDITASAPGYGVILHIAGRDDPDGDHHGTGVTDFDDPAVHAELCAAMGG
jgi:hypothetical protein